jgi:hypothetical protein
MSMTAPTGGRLNLGYDLDGRIRKRTVSGDGADWVTEYHYDIARSGRPLDVFYPDGSSELYQAYDPDDVLSQFKNRYGHKVTNAVDSANRLVSMTPTDGPEGMKTYGMSWDYDGASRVTGVKKTAIAKADVATSAFDLGGRPVSSALGIGGTFARTFDTFDNARELTVTGQIVADALRSDPKFGRDYDLLNRPTRSVLTQSTSGTPGPGTTAMSGVPAVKMSWSGLASLALVNTEDLGPLYLSRNYTTPGRLDLINFGPLPGSLGRLGLGYRPSDAYKTSRSVSTEATVNAGVFSNQGWGFTPDLALRLKRAEAGPLENFTYSYGSRDELLSLTQEKKDRRSDLKPDVEGRILSRDNVNYTHDVMGNRTEDERYLYTFTWRGELSTLEVKKTWPPLRVGEADVTPVYSQNKLFFEYDALGRLISRTHKGKLPEGVTGDAQRPFIETREYLWEGKTLLAEVGKNPDDSIRWRKTYLPGPTGQDDPVQMRVENYATGGGTTPTAFAFLRDEQSTVLGLIDEQPQSTRGPPVPARYLYTPLGEAHVELGPELLRATFDPSLTVLNGSAQNPPRPKETIAGGLTFITTISFDSASLSSGTTIESCSADYTTCNPTAAFLVAEQQTDATKLSMLPLDAWPKATHFRFRLTPTLRDDMGRAFQSPDSRAYFEIKLDIPADGLTAPLYDRSFEFVYDTIKAAGETVGGRIPGGMNLLHGGSWTDPVSGLQYEGFSWYDPRSGEYLSESSAEGLSEYAAEGFAANQGVSATAEYVAPETSPYVAPIGPLPEEPSLLESIAGRVALDSTILRIPAMVKDFSDSLIERVGAGQSLRKSVIGAALDQSPIPIDFDAFTDGGDESENLLCVSDDMLVLTPRGRVPAGEIRVGQRVITKPQFSQDCAVPDTDVDGATWMLVRLAIPRAFPHVGETLTIEVLRPAEWVSENGLAAGAVVPFELEGAAVPASVLAVEPAPPIEPGPGRVVVMKSARRTTEILELRVDGAAEPMRATADHPFLVEGRDWIEAGALSAGERLVTQNGEAAVLESVTRSKGPVAVVNFEVEADHDYFVSAGEGGPSVLVHNGIGGLSPRLGFGETHRAAAAYRRFGKRFLSRLEARGLANAADVQRIRGLSLLQRITNRQAEILRTTPGLFDRLLSAEQKARIAVEPWRREMFYGSVFEKQMVARRIRSSGRLSSLFEHVGNLAGRAGPMVDFEGRGRLRGLLFDVTTGLQMQGKAAKYGVEVLVPTYFR